MGDKKEATPRGMDVEISWFIKDEDADRVCRKIKKWSMDGALIFDEDIAQTWLRGDVDETLLKQMGVILLVLEKKGKIKRVIRGGRPDECWYKWKPTKKINV